MTDPSTTNENTTAHPMTALADTAKSIVVFRELPADQLARLAAAHRVTVADPRTDIDSFHAGLKTAHGLIGASHPVDIALLDAAPLLEAISSISVGVDNYPLAELHRRGIVLCHTPGVLDETVADTVFALLMATSRRLVELATLVCSGGWTQSVGEDRFGFDVHGKTIGLLGFGASARRWRGALRCVSVCRCCTTHGVRWTSPRRRPRCWVMPATRRSTNCWRALISWCRCCRCRTAPAA